METALKHFYIISYSSNRFGDLLMNNQFQIGDGYDEFRNGAGNISTLMKANPFSLLQWVKGNPGKIVKVICNRRVPKNVTNHLTKSGKGYNCPCWEIIIHYEVDGKEFISFTCITKSCL